MIKIHKENVLILHKMILESSGGRDGVRDFGLLDSALNSAFQTFDGFELYPSMEEKAARLGYCLISNHPFVDGNKRIGILVMLSFLTINGINIKSTDEELISIGMSLASGKMKYDGLVEWINNHKSRCKEQTR